MTTMQRYSKGARAERELLNFLAGIGFSVIRAAGSGVNSVSPPDLVAVKKGKGLAFECKAWDNTSLAIDHEKFAALKNWMDNTGMETYMAWRMNGSGWFFIRLDEMSRTEKNYTVTKKIALGINRNLKQMFETPEPTRAEG